MTQKKPPLILVDGSSYLYRAFHALPPLTNSKGQPTGAVYGVVNMLKKLIEQYHPQYMAVVFDAKGKNFRHEMFADYKAHRPPMPDELRAQIEPLHELVDALGLPKLVVPGVEADDVIGTLATQAAKQGMEVLISTGDKDMAQLVDKHITLINTMNNSVLDIPGVVEKFGVPAERIVDYLALIGDTSDNIPGVPKVGPKTAVKWLQEYGSLENIVQHAADIKGKIGDNLRDSLEQIPLSYKLATIVCEVELDQKPTDLALMTPDREKLHRLYSNLEFKTWLKELDSHKARPDDIQPQQDTSFRRKAESMVDNVPDSGLHRDDDNVVAAAEIEKQWETVVDESRFNFWLAELNKAEIFAFDTETTSLDYMQARIVGVSFCVEPGKAAYVPIGHDYPDAPDQLDANKVLAALRPLLENPGKKKLGQNLKYDTHVLANHGINMQGVAHDTLLESFVLDSTKRHDMDSMAERLLHYTTIHFEDVAGKGAKQLTFNQVDLQQAGPYAAEDADITLRLHQVLQKQMQKVPSLKKIYEEIELPLMPVIQRIERNGVRVDAAMLAQQSRELSARLAQIEKQAFEVAGESFNLGSPKQLQQILFEKMGIKSLRKTPKGQPSTAEDVLEELAAEYELPRLILEHRGMSKLKSTYTDKLPLQINPQTGRVHTSYNQTGAATGRLSSTDPNLQNIPVRTEEGRRIRQAFIAEPGNKLISADYSQIELRIMAHLSGDKGLLKAFSEGRDIHRATAAEVFALNLDDVSTEQRRAAKAINFGLIYGMSAFGLARQLGIGRNEAQAYVEMYFARYPGVKDYMDNTRQRAHETGYVETVFGRRLYLPDINAKNGQLRQYAERTAINAPMQGTAADIIKMAMITLDKSLQASKFNVRMVMQVHDELVLEVNENQVEAVREMVIREMQSAAKLKVPLIVEAGVGDNWDQAH
ncbi:MAG TPA: DNA polymerase I [Gammaproteobacteria bacterium]|nr:DNA polymerase I [Gammaproteobacteria bacterium]